MLTSRQILGKKIENLASSYLQNLGLKLITANYRAKSGEIDLIMEDRKTLVFFEVRYRKDAAYGGSIATVDKKKQRRISRAATNYLQEHHLYDQVACRFDVVAVSGISEYQLHWIRDAFWVQW